MDTLFGESIPTEGQHAIAAAHSHQAATEAATDTDIGCHRDRADCWRAAALVLLAYHGLRHVARFGVQRKLVGARRELSRRGRWRQDVMVRRAVGDTRTENLAREFASYSK